MLPCTFQNVSLPTHVHFHSAVLSGPAVEVRRSLLPASLIRAPVDGPSWQRTDTEDCGEVRALTPNLTLLPPHVCVIAEHTGLSPLACTCSRTRSHHGRLHAHALSHATDHRRSLEQKNGYNLPLDTVVIVVFVSARVLRPTWRGHIRHHCDGPVQLSETNSLLLKFTNPLSDHDSKKTCLPLRHFFDANGTSL